MSPLPRVLRLAALLFLVGLTTSRLALVVHELGGHAAPVLALGGHVTSVHFFLFAGGYVTYDRVQPLALDERLLVSLGGIALELMAGAALLAITRMRAVKRRPIARVATLGAGTVLLLHALFYLSSSAYHGYGDGYTLRHWLGDRRLWLVVPVAVVAVVAGFACARTLVGELSAWMTGSGRAARVGWILLAVGLAGGAHAALTFGELGLRANRTYAGVMKREDTRIADRALERYLAMQRARGAAPDAATVRARQRVLRAEYREPPVGLLIAIAIGLACLLGAAVARPRDGAADEVPRWRRLLRPAVVAALAVALVGVVSLL